MRKKIITLIIVSCIVVSGCSPTYDVLTEVADTTSVGESLNDKIEYKFSTVSDAVDYTISELAAIVNNSKSEADDSIDILGERPEYNPLEYVDVENVNLDSIKITKDQYEVTEDEIDKEIKSRMQTAGIYNENIKTVQKDSVINASYKIIDTDTNEELSSSDETDIDISKDFFPENINKAIIGSKAGDKITVDYTFNKDDTSPYAGKNTKYEITINDVKNFDLTNDIVEKISDKKYNTVNDYKKHIKAKLAESKKEAAAAEQLSNILESLNIKSYPEDVVNYELQKQIFEYYQSLGVTTSQDDIFTSYIEERGFTTVEDFYEYLKTNIKNDLENEIKILAITKNAGLWTEDQNELITELESVLNETIDGETYIEENSKYKAQYIVSYNKILKEIIKNE